MWRGVDLGWTIPGVQGRLKAKGGIQARTSGVVYFEPVANSIFVLSPYTPARTVRRTCWSRPMTREGTPLLSRPLNRLRGREEGRGSRRRRAMRQAGWHGNGSTVQVRPQKTANGILLKGRCPEAGSPGTRRERPALAESCRAQARLAGRGGARLSFCPWAVPGRSRDPARRTRRQGGVGTLQQPRLRGTPCPAGIVQELGKDSMFWKKLYHAEAEYVASPIP